jgi:hypothetical protein
MGDRGGSGKTHLARESFQKLMRVVEFPRARRGEDELSR